MCFVYVMSKEDRNKMIAMGYSLIKEDERNNVWIFKNKDVSTFASEDEITEAGVSFVLSDMLTF
mgnify:CR=1 FL=1